MSDETKDGHRGEYILLVQLFHSLSALGISLPARRQRISKTSRNGVTFLANIFVVSGLLLHKLL